MNTMSEFVQYHEEMLEAMCSFDLKTVRAWMARWYSNPDVMTDDVLEITIRKCVYNMTDAPEDKRAEAREWLESRGYDCEVFK